MMTSGAVKMAPLNLAMRKMIDEREWVGVDDELDFSPPPPPPSPSTFVCFLLLYFIVVGAFQGFFLLHLSNKWIGKLTFFVLGSNQFIIIISTDRAVGGTYFFKLQLEHHLSNK